MDKNQLKHIIKEEYHNVKSFMEDKYGFTPELGQVISNPYAKSFVNEVQEPEVISQLRDIVNKKQNKKIKDPKSGKMMRVDMYSASAIVKVYDAVNKSNKEKFSKLSLPKMVNVAFTVMKKESVNELLVIVDKFDKNKQDYGKIYYRDGGNKPGDGDINKANKELVKLSKKHKGLTLVSVGRNSKMYDVNESLNEAKYKHTYKSITDQQKDLKRIFPSGHPRVSVKAYHDMNPQGKMKTSYVEIEGPSSYVDAYKKMAFNGKGTMRDVIKSVEKNESVNEAFVVAYGKGPKPIKPAFAAYADKKMAQKFMADMKKDGYKVMMTQKKIRGVDESVNEASMDWEKNFKWANDKELKVISKFIFMNDKGIDGVIKMSKHKPFAFRRTIQKMAKKGLHEGKKRYNQKDGVGKSKYVISYHDGKKKHKDGSDFFDIQIFRNKKDLAKFVNTLHKGGYKYGFGESINEASREAMGIAGFTGTRGSAVQKFIDDYNLNARKLFNFVKKGKLKDRLDFVTAIAGKPGNKFQGKMVGMFGESVNEEKKCPPGQYYCKRSGTCKPNSMREDKSQISKIKKQAGKKEIKFYDILSKLEKKMGKKKYRDFLVKSLKDFKINGNHYDYRTNAAAEEKLFQLAK